MARTSDGGLSWQRIEFDRDWPLGPFALTAGHVLAAAPVTGIALYDIATASWEYASTDASAEFDKVTFASRGIGYGTTFDGALWMTEDGGETWSPLSDDVRWNILESGALSAVDESRTIYLTDDGGRTTRPIAPPPEAASSSNFGVVAAVDDRVWLRLEDGLWRTDNGGDSWRRVDWAYGGNYHFIDVAHGWTDSCPLGQCIEGAIRVTEDGGDTWETRSLPANAYQDVAFTAPLIGWVGISDPAGDCFCKAVTRDGGRSWQTISTAPWSLSMMLPLDEERIVGVAALVSPGQTPIIVSSDDGGVTWDVEVTLEEWGRTRLVARDGRAWLYYSTSQPTFLHSPYQAPRRTVIYRFD